MSKRTSRPWYLYLLATAAAVLVVLGIAEIGPPTSSARTSTQLVTAENGVVQSTVTGPGNIAAGTDLDVNFQTSGTLSSVSVAQGQHVTKGQLLGTLNSTQAQLSLDQAEQNLVAAEDQLSSAESSSTSTSSTSTAAPAGAGGSAGSGSNASGSSGSSSSSSTDPDATIASAQAAVYGAQASVNTAETALAETKLFAPISGTIVSLSSLSPGDAVSAGSTSSASTSGTSSGGSSSGSSTGGTAGTTAGGLGGSSSSSSSTSGGSTSPFAEIVNTGSMDMTVALSESDVSKVKVGQPATVTLDALTGVELAAHVSAISTVGTTSSGVVSYNATLTLDEANSQVKPGMSASASIIVAQAQGVNVPNSVLTGTGSIATVTLDSNGKKTQQQVAVGLRGSTRTQIVSGLSAGQQLAVTTVLPALTSGTSTTSSTGSGTLGGTTVRPGGFGGGGGLGGGGAASGAGGGARGGATGAGAGG